jgi:predicted AlkP superfamily phosphohydrolase/phosphomutase
MRQPLDVIRARLKVVGLDEKWAPELKRRLGGVLDGYYVLVDNMLGRMRIAAGPDSTLVVVSDHGWGDAAVDGTVHAEVPFDGQHRMEGVFMMHGPGVEKGVLKASTLYDVAPTVIYALGMPVPRALPGQVIREAFPSRRLTAQPIERVNYKSMVAKRSTEGSGAHFEDQEIERLRSLGYVQ